MHLRVRSYVGPWRRRAAKRRFRLPADTRVVSCYEAGRDGFWLHRFLEALVVRHHVVDSSSLTVDHRARRAKTDRIHVTGLLTMLVRHAQSEPGVWRVVHVPSPEAERSKATRTRNDPAMDQIRQLILSRGIRHGYRRRWADGGSRIRRIGIVALTRKLLIELWTYFETGAIPEEATTT